MSSRRVRKSDRPGETREDEREWGEGVRGGEPEGEGGARHRVWGRPRTGMGASRPIVEQ